MAHLDVVMAASPFSAGDLGRTILRAAADDSGDLHYQRWLRGGLDQLGSSWLSLPLLALVSR
jgi:hypothetical protein